jgi:hypothetical protein
MTNPKEYRKLTTPRSAAVAGILFAVLFSASIILVRTVTPQELTYEVSWLEQGAGRITLAIALMPFAGIAFLWFIGVVRDRLGEYEDRLFATVFFGSSLLFLAMVFVSMAIAGSILAVAQMGTELAISNDIIYFARALMLQISNVYALRMAGVSMISLGTIWWRTGLMPRWMAIITYLLALTLLVIINLNLWVALIFPAWVLLISVYKLVSLPNIAAPGDVR